MDNQIYSIIPIRRYAYQDRTGHKHLCCNQHIEMLLYSRLRPTKLALLLTAGKQLQVFVALLLLLSIVVLQQRVQIQPLPLEAVQRLLQLQKALQLNAEHNLTQLGEHNHLQQEDTLVKQPQDLLDIYSHNILDSPQMSAVQQWPHGIRYVLGDLFPWYPPKKLKYGKPRLGESTLT